MRTALQIKASKILYVSMHNTKEPRWRKVIFFIKRQWETTLSLHNNWPDEIFNFLWSIWDLCPLTEFPWVEVVQSRSTLKISSIISIIINGEKWNDFSYLHWNKIPFLKSFFFQVSPIRFSFQGVSFLRKVYLFLRCVIVNS